MTEQEKLLIGALDGIISFMLRVGQPGDAPLTVRHTVGREVASVRILRNAIAGTIEPGDGQSRL